MGGAVSGADSEQIEELKFIGNEIGIAFQIQDDLLDAIADPKKFGKKRGGDIIEGKKTYLTLLALQRCSERQKKVLQDILSDKNATSSQVQKVIDIYEDLNIVSESEEAVRYHYQTAMQHLEQFVSSEYKEEVITFLNRLISREY